MKNAKLTDFIPKCFHRHQLGDVIQIKCRDTAVFYETDTSIGLAVFSGLGVRLGELSPI